MAEVFISYKRRMRPRVVEIAEALEALGLTVWYDAELVAGRSFGAVINSELGKASCILVCWTPDAFAPEDGSEVSWVEAEASVARERKAIVPVMLERTQLAAPWNMIHTERLIEWSSVKTPADPSWLGVLEAIGGLVGRPGLAAYVEAHAKNDPHALRDWAKKYPDDPLVGRGTRRKAASSVGDTAEAPAPEPSRAQPMRDFFDGVRRTTPSARWLLAATAVCVVGAALFLLRVGADMSGQAASYMQLAGPIISSAVFAFALWRARVLDFGRALFSIFGGIVGWVASLFTAPLAPFLASAIGFGGEATTRFSQGLLAGFVGSFIALGGIALLAGVTSPMFWGRIVTGCIVLALVCAVVSAGLLSFVSDSYIFWLVTVWTLGYGLLMTWLFADRVVVPAPARR